MSSKNGALDADQGVAHGLSIALFDWLAGRGETVVGIKIATCPRVPSTNSER